MPATLLLVGDVNLMNVGDPAAPFARIGAAFAEADAIFGNLECLLYHPPDGHSVEQEGFFADPMYGGNKDKVAWKMIGFPGLPASYREEIKTYFGKKYDKAPQSIADFS